MALYPSMASVLLAVALAWPSQTTKPGAERDASMHNTITIRVGAKAFVATLADNATAAAFRKLLPLAVTMTDLNGNEKYARLSVSLPVRPATPPGIRTGDLMMHGASTVVVFYKSFSTAYSYTNIGRIEDPDGLEAALGSGSVEVTFEQRRDGRR